MILASLILALSQERAPDVRFDLAYGELPKQVLDLYLPAVGPGGGFPTVVFIYGSGWHSGSGKSCAAVAERLGAHGFGCALLSHRLSPPDLWPAMIEDVARAFAWVHTHVGEHGGDPGSLFLMGHSSGAQLALLLATDPHWLAVHGLGPADVRGVVGLSTPLDLVPRADGRGYGDILMRGHGADVFGRDRETLAQASPLTQLARALPPALLPPTLLVVGERDFPMLAGDARAFAARAAELGLEVPLWEASGRDHMGVVAALTEEQDPTALTVLAFLDRLRTPVSDGPAPAQPSDGDPRR